MIQFLMVYTLALLIACTESAQEKEWAGTLEPAGITTYQYGTHILVRSDSIYASLRSSLLDLEDYENQEVVVRGTLVDGYPLEGGPVLIEVTEVKIVSTR